MRDSENDAFMLMDGDTAVMLFCIAVAVAGLLGWL